MERRNTFVSYLCLWWFNIYIFFYLYLLFSVLCVKLFMNFFFYIFLKIININNENFKMFNSYTISSISLFVDFFNDRARSLKYRKPIHEFWREVCLFTKMCWKNCRVHPGLTGHVNIAILSKTSTVLHVQTSM